MRIPSKPRPGELRGSGLPWDRGQSWPWVFVSSPKPWIPPQTHTKRHLGVANEGAMPALRRVTFDSGGSQANSPGYTRLVAVIT